MRWFQRAKEESVVVGMATKFRVGPQVSQPPSGGEGLMANMTLTVLDDITVPCTMLRCAGQSARMLACCLSGQCCGPLMRDFMKLGVTPRIV